MKKIKIINYERGDVNLDLYYVRESTEFFYNEFDRVEKIVCKKSYKYNSSVLKKSLRTVNYFYGKTVISIYEETLFGIERARYNRREGSAIFDSNNCIESIRKPRADLLSKETTVNVRMSSSNKFFSNDMSDNYLSSIDEFTFDDNSTHSLRLRYNHKDNYDWSASYCTGAKDRSNLDMNWFLNQNTDFVFLNYHTFYLGLLGFLGKKRLLFENSSESRDYEYFYKYEFDDDSCITKCIITNTYNPYIDYDDYEFLKVKFGTYKCATVNIEYNSLEFYTQKYIEIVSDIDECKNIENIIKEKREFNLKNNLQENEKESKLLVCKLKEIKIYGKNIYDLYVMLNELKDVAEQSKEKSILISKIYYSLHYYKTSYEIFKEVADNNNPDDILQLAKLKENANIYNDDHCIRDKGYWGLPEKYRL